MKTSFFLLLVLFSMITCYGQTGDEYYNSGQSKYDLKDFKGAVADYSKAIDTNPNIVEAYNSRGLSKIRLLDYSGAVEDFNKYLETNPTDAAAYYNRGLAKVLLKQKENGCKDLRMAEELGHAKANETIKRNCN